MNEFIKIKNDTGDGDMLLKTGFIFRVYDKSGGGANIVYGGKPEEATVFKTASTAAEVLAAIEGAQTAKGVMVDASGGSNGVSSYGPGDILYSTGEVTPRTRPIDTSERLGLVSREEYESKHGELTEILRAEGERVLTKLDPDTLAVVCAGQMLARELEIRTGDKWRVTAQPTLIGFYFALEWGKFRGRTESCPKYLFVEMEDGRMAEWAQEIAEEMVAKSLREMPIDISSVGDERSKRAPFEGLDSLIGTPCTCSDLISGHDPDCPWY